MQFCIPYPRIYCKVLVWAGLSGWYGCHSHRPTQGQGPAWQASHSILPTQPDAIKSRYTWLGRQQGSVEKGSDGCRPGNSGGTAQTVRPEASGVVGGKP